jgi:hypothetical protein
VQVQIRSHLSPCCPSASLACTLQDSRGAAHHYTFILSSFRANMIELSLAACGSAPKGRAPPPPLGQWCLRLLGQSAKWRHRRLQGSDEAIASLAQPQGSTADVNGRVQHLSGVPHAKGDMRRGARLGSAHRSTFPYTLPAQAPNLPAFIYTPTNFIATRTATIYALASDRDSLRSLQHPQPLQHPPGGRSSLQQRNASQKAQASC